MADLWQSILINHIPKHFSCILLSLRFPSPPLILSPSCTSGWITQAWSPTNPHVFKTWEETEGLKETHAIIGSKCKFHTQHRMLGLNLCHWSHMAATSSAALNCPLVILQIVLHLINVSGELCGCRNRFDTGHSDRRLYKWIKICLNQ